MKAYLAQLNKVFENRVRLGIMSVLMVNESEDFNTLKKLLGVTDGNLASHISKLEKEKYVTVHKSFLGKKPHTSYSSTKKGRDAFEKHLDALEKILNLS